jgi:SAM-dependent methyltransferase
MDPFLDDSAARREALERWIAARQPSKLRTKLAFARAKLAPKRLQQQFAFASQRLVSRVLDRGPDTSDRIVEPEHDHPDRIYYMPSPWHVVPRALRYVGVSEDDVFADFGCGKGRAVHQAAKWPFRRVIGVEISGDLAEIARTYLKARSQEHRCRNVEIVTADVGEYQVPDDLTIAYLFHPVVNETFDAVVRRLIDSLDRHPRPLRLIYVCPALSSAVLATGRFRLVKEQRSRLFDTHASRAEIFESC